ncbi:NAD(P)/FAD-dependent oxidoreductase [Iodobacter sp. LRB]|uniref:FAD-dependent oxidoreductase n=1 Tax=unclassified Iodobacter TaxID=235634 RepID=UPI000C0D0D59|nr:NAD(P)/FAD-dependent oxidoreductase [Iodobacter sp. BJB302]PHV01048.1 hypothetical protein CSQ88_14245 [Iodobacter sp. BJB302]
MMKSPVRVAIIGAGPAGLCLAQGLKKQGITAQVYEKNAALSPRHQGYRLRIDAIGQAALAQCLPASLFELFIASCAAPATVQTLDAELNAVSEKWVDHWHRTPHQPDLRADRQLLRELLMTDLDGQLHFAKALSRYEWLPDQSIAAYFEDGSVAVADILVGADGVHSSVMALRFPGLQAVDTGEVCCYGKTLLNQATCNAIAAKLQTGTSVIFEQGLAVVVDVMRFAATTAHTAWHPPHDYIYWALIGKRARFGVAADDNLRYTDAQLRGLIASLSRSWPAELRALFELAAPQAAMLVPVRSMPRIAPWPATQVTAIGDALHVMSPASGLGVNAALFDAASLSSAIAEIYRGTMSLLQAITEHENRVRAHSFAAVELSGKGNWQLFGESQAHQGAEQ